VESTFAEKEQELVKAFFNQYVKLLYFKSGYGVSKLENFD
jgi:hypothetical protein